MEIILFEARVVPYVFDSVPYKEISKDEYFRFSKQTFGILVIYTEHTEWRLCCKYFLYKNNTKNKIYSD